MATPQLVGQTVSHYRIIQKLGGCADRHGDTSLPRRDEVLQFYRQQGQKPPNWLF